MKYAVLCTGLFTVMCSLACGGQLAVNGDCMPDAGKGCGSSSGLPVEPKDAAVSGLVCGPGTYAFDGECLPIPTSSTSDAGASIGDSGADAESDGSGAGIDVNTACLVADSKFVLLDSPWGSPENPPIVIEGGTGWVANVYDTVDGLPSLLDISVGANWTATFSTKSLGKPLLPGLYTGVQRAEFTDPNVPGLDVYGDGAGCNTVTGQFRVLEMKAIPADVDAGVASPVLQSFTAVFEQHCEGGDAATIGCVHFAP